MADSETRRRILARKAVLASLAGLAACAHHETATVTVEPLATAPAASSSSPHVVRAPPPPPQPDDDDSVVVRHPMHGSDPVGPPIVRPTPPPWSALLGKLSVSSTPKPSGGHRVVEVTLTLAAPLRMNEQRIEINVSGGKIVKPTSTRESGGAQSVIITLEPYQDPVHIMLGVIDRDAGRIGHARFEVSASSAKVTGLD